MSANDQDPNGEDDVDKEPLPRSLKMFLAILGALVLVVIVAHLLGKGLGGHG